jgi:hypothetical protein
MKYFDASHDFIGQRRSVRCDDWSIVFTGFTRRIVLLIRFSVPLDCFSIIGRVPDRLCSLYRASSSTERSRARSNSCVREELAARYHNFLIPD